MNSLNFCLISQSYMMFLKNGLDRPIKMVHLGTEPLSVWSYIYIAYAIEHEISTP